MLGGVFRAKVYQRTLRTRFTAWHSGHGVEQRVNKKRY